MTVALQGDYGKPRPALVVQADRFEATATVTVLLISATLIEAPLLRPTIAPSPTNGLRKASQVMMDKAMTIRRDKLGPVFGHLDEAALISVTRALALFLGLA